MLGREERAREQYNTMSGRKCERKRKNTGRDRRKEGSIYKAVWMISHTHTQT